MRACIGGTNVRDEVQAFRGPRMPHVVVGTPGRVLDLITTRRVLPMQHVRVLVLDEADQLLEHSFVDQIREIFVQLPATVQACVFSATFPQECVDLTRAFLRPDAVHLVIKREEITLSGIKQFAVEVRSDRDKIACVVDLLGDLAWSQCVLFSNSSERAVALAEGLMAEEFPVGLIHGRLSQADRSQNMDRFRRGDARILVATDILARGIDVQQCSFVINVDMPRDAATYIHRVGRSGRFGRKGLAISLCTPADWGKIDSLCKYYSTDIPMLPADLKSLN